MTHRERVLTALSHREPDRLPMDFGSARVSGIVRGAHQNLLAHLGYGKLGDEYDKMQQLNEVDEKVLREFDVDVRGVCLNAPDIDGDEILPDGRYKDEWGVIRVKPEGCLFYELQTSPLAGSITVRDIVLYPCPDPVDAGRFRGVREKLRRLHEETDYAVIFNARYSVVHQTQYLRGFEDWYCDLAADHDLFQALMEAVTENYLAQNQRAFEEFGEYIDIVGFGDDVGLQDRPVCSLPLYRKLIRPYHARCIEQAHTLTKAKVFYHTCGSVYAYINDFIDIGVDVLNPVQVTAKHMVPEKLKAEFGDRIAFWGGIDTQHLMPHGKPEEVDSEVRRMFEIMGPDGGWILTAVHNIQNDVPPENIVALYKAGRECRYESAVTA